MSLAGAFFASNRARSRNFFMHVLPQWINDRCKSGQSLCFGMLKKDEEKGHKFPATS